MKSRKYWEKRSNQKLLDNLKDADKMLESLKSDYDKAINNINNEIAKLYGRFAVDNKLDINTAQEIIKGNEFKEWRLKIEEYLSEIAKGDEALLLELNVLSMRSRISRLEALEGEIVANVSIIANSQDMKATEVLTKSLENTYYSNMYNHYKDKNSKILELMEKHQVKLSKANINAVLSLPWSGNNYSKNIWKREYNVAQKVKSLVTQNIISGASIDRLSNVVAEELGKDYKTSATTLIHTEVAYVKGQGDLITYKKLGVDEYEFSATLDSKTSEPCRNNDGKHFKVTEAVPGLNYPPMHPRCRSTTISYVKDKGNRTKAARGNDGRTYKVPANMNYNEWYNKYGENFSGIIKVTNNNPRLQKLLNDISDMKDIDITQRRKFSKQLLKNLDLEEIPISIMNIKEHGYCEIAIQDGISTINKYVLNSKDLRNDNYKIKTAFHEAYHAKANGLATDYLRHRSNWLDIEEVFAETSAHYLYKEFGLSAYISPSYPKKLVEMLPRLKKLDKFKNCETLEDFGKIAWIDRLNGVSAEWSDLHDSAMKINHSWTEYLGQYSEYIDNNKSDLLDTMLDNMPQYKKYKNNMSIDYDIALEKIKLGGSLTENEEMVVKNLLANAMKKIGVK